MTEQAWKRGWTGAIGLLLTLAIIPVWANPARGQSVSWIRQFAAPDGVTRALGVSAASSGIYVAGFTEGVFPGETSSGAYTDAFVRKYDAAGTVAWTRQFGGLPGPFNIAYAVSATSEAVYVAGYTQGTLPGEVSEGGWDAFLRKYDVAGTVVWTRQFGISDSANDIAYAVSATPEGIYVAGQTSGTPPEGSSSDSFNDGFIRKYDALGNVSWTRQFGIRVPDCPTSGCWSSATGVSATSEGVYVAGLTMTSERDPDSGNWVDSSDAFIRKYGDTGIVSWTRRFGAALMSDMATGVSATSSGIYVAGKGAPTGEASANEGAFVRKYDAMGSVAWTHQFGFGGLSQALAISAGPAGIYVAGEAEGEVGEYWHGTAFVRKLDAAGEVVWTRRFGLNADTTLHPASGVSAPPEGIYVAGAGTRLYEAFVARIASDRPDGLISRRASSSYVGDGIYNSSGRDQTLGAKVRLGAKTTFYIRAQNDGHVNDRLAIKGCSSSKAFIVRYLAGATGTTDITSKVVAGSYSVRLATGAWKAFRLVVRAKSTADVGAVKACDVSITSRSVDVVTGKVIARAQ